MGSKKKKQQNKAPLDRFHTAMDPAIKEAIQALAWYDRVSQREIVEQAFEITYSLKSHRVQKAIREYRKRKSS